MARWTGLVAALVAVVAMRVASPAPAGIPLVLVPQGVSEQEVDGARVFLLREGEVLTAFLGRSTASGERIVYCPAERAFVAPLDTSLWTERGEWVAGPAPRDLDQVKIVLDQRALRVRLDPRKVTRPEGRGEGEVSGEIGAAYQAYRSGDANAGFCHNPLPAPDAVPTPTQTAS
jgi:hypothetical protein